VCAVDATNVISRSAQPSFAFESVVRNAGLQHGYADAAARQS
jgi:hypothetical protein